MPVGDISPIGILKVPKAFLKDVEHWVHTRHRNFMASAHDKSGPLKLNFYTTAQTPVLSVDKDLISGPEQDADGQETGSEWIIWTEYYTNMDGLMDHWKKGGESGMLPDFMAMMGPDKVQPQFVQPLEVLHEINNLVAGEGGKPVAALADISDACQLMVKFVVPKEHVDEAQALVDHHAVWMNTLHVGHKMLDASVEFAAGEELLYYSASRCDVLTDQMDLSSEKDPEGKVIFLFTEYYKSKAGLDKQWENANKMAEKTGDDFTLARMNALEAKGMEAQFFQPLTVKGSINWFGDSSCPGA